jgi:hypothetical protein
LVGDITLGREEREAEKGRREISEIQFLNPTESWLFMAARNQSYAVLKSSELAIQISRLFQRPDDIKF